MKEHHYWSLVKNHIISLAEGEICRTACVAHLLTGGRDLPHCVRHISGSLPEARFATLRVSHLLLLAGGALANYLKLTALRPLGFSRTSPYRSKLLTALHEKSPALCAELQIVCGEGGIRTPGAFQLNSFQDCRNRPLYHLSKVCRPVFGTGLQI